MSKGPKFFINLSGEVLEVPYRHSIFISEVPLGFSRFCLYEKGYEMLHPVPSTVNPAVLAGRRSHSEQERDFLGQGGKTEEVLDGKGLPITVVEERLGKAKDAMRITEFHVEGEYNGYPFAGRLDNFRLTKKKVPWFLELKSSKSSVIWPEYQIQSFCYSYFLLEKFGIGSIDYVIRIQDRDTGELLGEENCTYYRDLDSLTKMYLDRAISLFSGQVNLERKPVRSACSWCIVPPDSCKYRTSFGGVGK